MTLADLYPWFKALHVISVISWMAGLLYLPRLFVYHADARPNSEETRTFEIMEARLLKIIMMPAMLASFLFGGLIMVSPGAVDWTTGWIWIKLVMIAGLVFMHVRMAQWHRQFSTGQNCHPARFYRFMNEIPTLLMIFIVLLAVVKPF